MEGEPPTPSQSPNPSSLLKDISNFKTPKQSLPNPRFQSPYPQFFTALKQTPTTATSTFRRRRPTTGAPSSRSKAARRLKAFELEQSLSSRKAQIHKEKSLKSLAKSLSVWLNFLFQNPRSCGCDLSALSGGDRAVVEDCGTVSANGKRDSWPGCGVGIDGPWRSPKRHRVLSTWRPEGFSDAEPFVASASAFSSLKVSLQEICSFDDLTQRMRGYLSLDCCKEVLSVMTQVAKNIDEGRLKMKAHCPIVTDVGMKDKAVRVLMCYNPVWLRIGLFIVFGGDSLLPTGDVNSDQELAFLKSIVEKLLFTHLGLAKAYAYNKLVEGLYRPGYFETLGKIILKRFLLLVLILDRAKSESSLPIKYGIDGIDGGSPLLFCRKSNIKSSRQLIQDFLSTEVMHGEGNLLAHLVIVGYRVSYQQQPLLDYDFSVINLFEDLQDGVRLCRAIQLLQCDNSILIKMVVPSDTHKKNLVNCGLAMQYLKQAGMTLLDEDGTTILPEDVASGEKELTLSMLWSMFAHLQMPLLINKMLLSEEICKIKGADMDYSKCNSFSHLEMLLEWIQVISQKYDIKIENSKSLIDGKAMWCLIDYYFHNELQCSCCKKAEDSNVEYPNLWDANYSDASHNFILSQKLTSILGNFPEVLQISDVLENNGAFNERSVIVLLVFLSSQLIGRKNMDQLNIHKILGCNCHSPEMKRFSSHKCFLNSELPEKYMGLNEDIKETEDATRNFKVIQAWWRDMAKHHHSCEMKQITDLQGLNAGIHASHIQREGAVRTIQSHFRGLIARRNFLKIKATTSFLQTVIRVWLNMKATRAAERFTFTTSKQECQNHPEIFERYRAFMVQRHSFIKLKKSVFLIQQAARAWINRKHHLEHNANLEIQAHGNLIAAAIIIQSHVRRWREMCRYVHMVSQLRRNKHISQEEEIKIIQGKAAVKIQLAWRRFSVNKSISIKCISVAKIQSHWRGWLTRRNFQDQKKAIIKIQSSFRCLMCLKYFQQYKIASMSAIMIQSHFRGFISRREAEKQRHLIILIQSRWRSWLIRKDFLSMKQAAVKIQSSFRCLRCSMTFQSYKLAAIEIQRFARGQTIRRRLLGASIYRSAILTDSTGQFTRSCVMNLELKVFLDSVRKLQLWWRRVILLRSETRSAITIQAHVRGWIGRTEASRRKRRIIVIQSYCKGYLARKESRGKLVDLRLRVQKSAAKVNDGMRLINRLLAALSELLGTRSVSSVLHTCATLDVATKHSQKCCETLVAAGAIDTLLQLIRSVSRSIPDQEVLKHAMSTLRNIAHYPQLADVLIDTSGSAETILWEFLRNKEEGFFIASELLKKLCSTKKGIETVHHLPAYLKRLQSLVDDLKKKVALEKRNRRQQPMKEDTERRLRDVTELLKLITNG